MHLHLTPLGLPMLAAAVLGLTLGIRLWNRGQVHGARALAFTQFAAAWWALCAIFVLGFHDLDTRVLWTKLLQLGVAPLAVFYYEFAVHYGHPPAAVRKVPTAVLFVIPVLTLVFAFGFPGMTLLWESVSVHPQTGFLIFTLGPWFWVHAVYSYLLLLAGAAELLRTMTRSSTFYRSQVLAFVASALLPFAANLVFVSDVSPLMGFDPTPLSFVLSGVLLWWGVMRLNLLDLAPIARDTLLDTMTDPVVVIDRQRRIVDANLALRTLLAPAGGELVGASAEAMFAAHGMDLSHHLHCDVTQDARMLTGREDRVFHARSTPLVDARGVQSGCVLVLRDVTEQSRAQETLRSHSEELETRNAELNAFAHTVAHDLKTPLAALSGYSDLLLDDWHTLSREERARCLRAVLDGATRMDQTIHEILALASVRRAAAVPLGAIDTGGIISEVREDLSRMLADSEATLMLPDSWPSVRGYRPWVREVWLNYLSNAIKYGGRPEHGIPPRISIGWEKADTLEAADAVRFWVEDNGAGLTPEQQEKLFVEFTRLERDRVEGHGLGLSIVLRIVSRLGGSAGVTSAPGRGSRFWFTLRAENN